MPNFRRKSCHQCRSSKLACDRRQPRCSRCEQRNWLCCYSLLSKPTPYLENRYRQLRSPQLCTTGPSSELSPLDNSSIETAITTSTRELNDRRSASGFDPTDTIDDIGDFGWAAVSANTTDDAFWPDDVLGNCAKLPPTAPIADMSPDIVTNIIADINTQISIRANFELSMLVDIDHLLRPRKHKTAEALLTSKMMLGSMRKYPAMLISDLNLPPFISSPCFGDEILCRQSGIHQCLPQPLAACASIVRMFPSDSLRDRSFAWKTIYMEQQRLFHEHESYDRETLIAAVQAVTLYTILHVEDVASIPEHYLRSITVTLGVCLCCAAGFVHVYR
ncbi:hypothetical protein CLIM01_05134 [Colletotrichum limetticola]|uniref:Zn(2)-C6 fungal-type domain-containing protein n=1 Tax=Colletotrichum limetticola TaxID=1209924 RepID=A0ABQ9Q132_9PEZI|nr:hypothetical protein CLIM01_05134 [Colletotrichum limetticola]